MNGEAATAVALDAVLPLTCTREGTCCHGKAVWVNPWELACLARSVGRPVSALLAHDLCDGGIRLRFAGPAGAGGRAACNLYRPGAGCAGHAGRPLACRLYPLGRVRHGQRVHYHHDGAQFPCLSGCPGVRALPALSVSTYLQQQGVAEGEQVADAYLEVVQDLAEGAFAVVIDSGLVASGHRGLHAHWQGLGGVTHAERAARIPPHLLSALLDPTAPAVPVQDPEPAVPALGSALGPALDPALDPAHGPAFVQAHAHQLQVLLQASYGRLAGAEQLAQASLELLAMALHLAASLNADRQVLMARWLAVATQAGMR